jgi:metal-responsive CopG/Arc/MetJ family transcriptional regulator
MAETGSKEQVRTTLTLPGQLRDRIELAVDRGLATSRNSLIVQAVESYLEEQEYAWIDAQFASMAQDEDYQALQRQVVAEFSASDWEALQADGARS